MIVGINVVLNCQNVTIFICGVKSLLGCSLSIGLSLVLNCLTIATNVYLGWIASAIFSSYLWALEWEASDLSLWRHQYSPPLTSPPPPPTSPPPPTLPPPPPPTSPTPPPASPTLPPTSHMPTSATPSPTPTPTSHIPLFLLLLCLIIFLLLSFSSSSAFLYSSSCFLLLLFRNFNLLLVSLVWTSPSHLIPFAQLYPIQTSLFF